MGLLLSVGALAVGMTSPKDHAEVVEQSKVNMTQTEPMELTVIRKRSLFQKAIKESLRWSEGPNREKERESMERVRGKHGGKKVGAWSLWLA